MKDEESKPRRCYKAIQTKYVAATSRNPAKIVAVEPDGGKATITQGEWEQVSDARMSVAEEAHRLAAKKLCEKMNWSDSDKLVGGFNAIGYVWVFNHA